MSDIPIFSAQGKTDSEKLAELIKFMPSLSSAIDRQMSSLDFNNLNESLRKRIEDSVTEHQDLSEYATRAHTNWQATDAKSYAASAAETARSNAVAEAYSDAVNLANSALSQAQSYTNNLINALPTASDIQGWINTAINTYNDTISDILNKAEKAYTQACTTSSFWESDTLLDRVKELESYH